MATTGLQGKGISSSGTLKGTSLWHAAEAFCTDAHENDELAAAPEE